MEPSVADLVRQIQEQGKQFVVVVAGGGQRAIDYLHSVPGATKIMLESRVIYAERSMDRYLGFTPERSVSAYTARCMAIEAYKVAEKLAHGPAVGVACTAALATSRDRRGADHAFIAIATAGNMYIAHTIFDRGIGRDEQERRLSESIVRTMASPELYERSDRPISQVDVELILNAANLQASSYERAGESLTDTLDSLV